MTPRTILQLSKPSVDEADKITTWGEFVAENDAAVVADVAEQIAEFGYAEIGGGAAPLVWIFASEAQ